MYLFSVFRAWYHFRICFRYAFWYWLRIFHFIEPILLNLSYHSLNILPKKIIIFHVSSDTCRHVPFATSSDSITRRNSIPRLVPPSSLQKWPHILSSTHIIVAWRPETRKKRQRSRASSNINVVWRPHESPPNTRPLNRFIRLEAISGE